VVTLVNNDFLLQKALHKTAGVEHFVSQKPPVFSFSDVINLFC